MDSCQRVNALAAGHTCVEFEVCVHHHAAYSSAFATSDFLGSFPNRHSNGRGERSNLRETKQPRVVKTQQWPVERSAPEVVPTSVQYN
jgi:hypothetical protein